MSVRQPIIALALLASLSAGFSLVLAACQSTIERATPTASGVGPFDSVPTTTVNASAADVASARAVIDSANLANSDTIDAVEGVRFTPAGEQAARTTLESVAATRER